MKKIKPLTAYQKAMILEFEEYALNRTGHDMNAGMADEIAGREISTPLGNCFAYVAHCAIKGRMPLNSRKWRKKARCKAILKDYANYISEKNSSHFMESGVKIRAVLGMFGFKEYRPKDPIYMIYPDLDDMREIILRDWARSTCDSKWVYENTLTEQSLKPYRQ